MAARSQLIVGLVALITNVRGFFVPDDDLGCAFELSR